MINNLAVYKESGDPWTIEELIKVQTYCGYMKGTERTGLSKIFTLCKYIFNNGNSNCDNNITTSMFLWTMQTEHINFPNCTKVSYEELFNHKLKTYRIKQ